MEPEPVAQAFPEERFLRDLMRVWDGLQPEGGAAGRAPAASTSGARQVGPSCRPPAGCDWEKFLGLVRRHGVAHAARAALGSVGEETVPASVTHALDRLLLESRSVVVLLQDRLGKLAHLFDEARVSFLVLKGPALQRLLYTEVGERPATDLDLLIHRSDLDRALAILEGAGFAVPSGGERRFWERSYHHIQLFMGRDLPVSVELHWDLELRERYPFPLEAMWARSIRFELGGRTLATLGHDDQYLFGAVHLARHFYAPRLVWVVDLRRMARRWRLDWEAIHRRAAQCRGRTALWFASTYEERVFGDTTQPAAIRPRLRPLQARLMRRLEGSRPLEPLRNVMPERRRIFAALLFFDRLSDLLRFLLVHGRRKLLLWSGIERILRRRA